MTTFLFYWALLRICKIVSAIGSIQLVITAANSVFFFLLLFKYAERERKKVVT